MIATFITASGAAEPTLIILILKHYPGKPSPLFLSRIGQGATWNFRQTRFTGSLVRSPARSINSQLPWKLGFDLFENASKARAKSAVVMQSACAIASDSMAADEWVD